jgi:acyl-CoA reductase-like NAD-dependent aldehyde dehydrogenase
VQLTSNVIGGRRVEARRGLTRENVEPATGQVLSHVVVSTAEDVDAACADALAASAGWGGLEPAERSARLRAWAAALRAEAAELAVLDARDTGTPRRTMLAGVHKGADFIDYFVGLGAELKGETLPATAQHLHVTLRAPYGLVGLILPFNHPAYFAISKVAPALVAGNTVVVKPAEQTPMSAQRIAELAAQTLGPGVYNVVQGNAQTGAALVAHPSVWRLHFTGSVSTALAIQAGAAATGQVKRITMELGGKNPLLAFPDVDPPVIAAAAVKGMNFTRNQGQSCGSTSRLFVHRSVYARTTALIQERMEAIRLGLPQDPDTEMGSLVSREQQRSVLDYVGTGVAEGARLRTGGVAPDGPLASGAYVLPTLLDEVRPDMRVAQEEIFGPVLSVIPWDDEQELYEQANNSMYGLTAAIYTRDLSTALRAARRIHAGYVWVNGTETRWPGVPFGGWKNSGIGVEHALEELLSYTQLKTVNILLDQEPAH